METESSSSIRQVRLLTEIRSLINRRHCDGEWHLERRFFCGHGSLQFRTCGIPREDEPRSSPCRRGDRNVALEMKRLRCNWGGESSGHVIASDYLPTGDGLFVALTVAHYLAKRQIDLSKFSNQVVLWPSKSGSFRVKKRIPLDKLPDLRKMLNRCNERMLKDGRSSYDIRGPNPKSGCWWKERVNPWLMKFFPICPRA